MIGSPIAFAEGRRKRKEKGEPVHNEIGERESISACLSSLSSWSCSSSMPWWGLTPPRGQAPVDVIHVHVSTLKRVPGIPRGRNEAAFQNVKVVRSMRAAFACNDAVH